MTNKILDTDRHVIDQANNGTIYIVPPPYG